MDRGEEEAEDKEISIQSKEDESCRKFLVMIPSDLIHEILLRLPAKSAAKFRCVSKLWSSITTRPDFLRSFVSHSSTRLCLFVCVNTRDKRLSCSIPQHENSDRSSYPHVERFRKNAPKFDYQSESVHGLICLGGFFGNIVLWNPTMRQHVTLPEPQPKVACVCSFFGYDPVEDKYKVLRFSGCNQDPLVFTLGPQESWRVTQNTPKHDPRFSWGLINKCINGNVYYEASITFGVNDSFEVEKVLMSFDVRYEKFNKIKKPADDLLSECFLDYEGKLSWVCADFSCIRFWVLEDEEKQEWSLRKFLIPIPIRDTIWEVSWGLRGITHDTGEFIFTDETTSEAISVLYYDPKRNRVRRVIYEGIGGEEFWKLNDHYNVREVRLYPNHSESLMSLEDVLA
ncbi:F-box domain [Arabidopsis suecica]|uniref:F-box domain n=1 Tax=Arabidopsis suecica TaxID=45249 RepID=A0A8T2BMX7_ARASU|nr:F-box domain [Arabidopsis suecica]